jgi:hypothetical protein
VTDALREGRRFHYKSFEHEKAKGVPTQSLEIMALSVYSDHRKSDLAQDCERYYRRYHPSQSVHGGNWDGFRKISGRRNDFLYPWIHKIGETGFLYIQDRIIPDISVGSFRFE